MKEVLFSEYFSFVRGRRLITADQIPGETAYISSTKSNNGISSFIAPPDFMTIHSNKMTLTNSGSVGYCFYHDYDFVASDHVTVIWIKDASVKLTRNIALYLKPIIEAIRYKYSFGREISDTRLDKEQVLLPMDNEQPDWAYMESHMDDLSKKIQWQKIKSKVEDEEKALDVGGWLDFQMDQIFTFTKGKRLTKEQLSPGKINFIGAISKNNGIRQRVDVEPLCKGNCITVNYNGSVGEAFYQAEPFWASDDVNILHLKNQEVQLNKYIALFLITVIEMNKGKFDFGRKWNTEKMKKTHICLPVTKEKKPRFDYMEQYIKALPYSDKI